MGGRSSSSSASTTNTTQIDERIAATDNAVVYDIGKGADVTLSDYDAISGAADIGLEAIRSLASITSQAVGQTGQAVETLQQGTDNVLEFVDTQNRDENNRTLTDIMPWLVAGASVLALSGAVKWGK